MFAINKFKSPRHQTSRYRARLNALQEQGLQTSCIEKAVMGAASNIQAAGKKSFVIYGEPQSGKTEMMIALTAKLLDLGNRIIVHLLNDSVALLEQNLDRFKRSALAPSPKSFQEILDPHVDLSQGEWVIFCKKNHKDLDKLIGKLAGQSSRIIIDDEADYATPNAKINKGEKTKINELIGTLLEDNGIYIGVTATPARLDLNNTYSNDSHLWVNFPPHNKYTGQDVFFPQDMNIDYRLNFLRDGHDDPENVRDAMLSFLINVAFLNNFENAKEKNYSMLVHTSGKTLDHTVDQKTIESIVAQLANPEHPNYEINVKRIWQIANNRFSEKADLLTTYILENISRNNIILMNTNRPKNIDVRSATDPAALFTFVVGGNIVSRGVTFDNLLSMYFTRDVKTKMQQDTYIQRARMFGSRGSYLKFFELTIPEKLYEDWHRCFVYHKLSLAAITEGKGSPVWLADNRVSAVSGSSIDRSTVSMNSGEMSFDLFDYEGQVENIVTKSDSVFNRYKALQNCFGDDSFPEYLVDYIKQFCPDGEESVALHESISIAGYKEGAGIDKANIVRPRGFIGTPQMQEKRFPKAIHHLIVFHNGNGRARLFYRYKGDIQFIKNQPSQ